ncbi:MAG TPA: hypothetical protein VGO60_10480 [Iamia sp.]|jgi:hypothetical protein|nr:hypothetical protein [Iamia sp.]
MTATRTPQERRDERAEQSRAEGPGGELRSVAMTLGLFAVMVVVVIGILLSQFGTVRDAASPVQRHDEAVGGDGWDDVRGRWETGPDGARVAEAGPQLSVAVRPVDGVDGEVEVQGTFGGDGWAVVVRWADPGTYALVMVEPDEGTISLVSVVSDRSRLLGSAALPPGDDGAVRSVAVALDGPVMDVRVDGVLAVAGRDDDLTDGTHAGVAVVGDHPGARFTHFRSAPPDEAGTRMITPGEGP